LGAALSAKTELCKCSTQNMFFRATLGTARSKFAVDHYGGTLRMPKVFAFDTVSVLFISWTTTSCEEPASRLTSSIASLQIAQPANHLYRNNRDGTFTDVTAKANLVRSGWGQGVCVGDYNNDGVMDLFVTYYGKNVLYRNNGDGTFTPATLLTMFARCSAAERTRLRTCSGRRLRRGRPRTRPRDCVVNELCW